MPNIQKQNPLVSIVAPHTTYIGETIVVPRLSIGLTLRGFSVDIIDIDGEWDHLQSNTFPENMRLIKLPTRRFMPWVPDIGRFSTWANYRLWGLLRGASMIPALAAYLRREKPKVLVARLLTTQATLGKQLSRTPAKLVLSMAGVPTDSYMRRILWPRIYPYADAFVAPNNEVAEHAARFSNVPRERFHNIPNPVIDDATLAKAKEPVDHPWITNRENPIILGVGRLTPQKGFDTLIRSLAILRSSIPARLIILGEGELRNSLTSLAESLGISEYLHMPGHESNPYRYMRAADVFVMSSRWEGPGHVLIEAQAIGTPAVSTSCPAGPKETLLEGEAGILVPVDDPVEMAKAIQTMLTDKDSAQRMVEKGKAASKRWYAESVADSWAEFLHILLKR